MIKGLRRHKDPRPSRLYLSLTPERAADIRATHTPVPGVVHGVSGLVCSACLHRLFPCPDLQDVDAWEAAR